MVVATGGAVALGIAAGAAVKWAAGVGIMAGAAGAAAGTEAAVVTAAGVGTAAGAITGAVEVGTLAGAGAHAVMGATAATGVGGFGAGTATVFAGGGLGLLTIGTSVNSKGNQITYDCWKPVLHDTSTEPSTGMLLKDIVCHPHIANVTVNLSNCPELPSIVLENIWNETFEIEYLLLQDKPRIVGHAKRVSVKKNV